MNDEDFARRYGRLDGWTDGWIVHRVECLSELQHVRWMDECVLNTYTTLHPFHSILFYLLRCNYTLRIQYDEYGGSIRLG